MYLKLETIRAQVPLVLCDASDRHTTQASTKRSRAVRPAAIRFRYFAQANQETISTANVTVSRATFCLSFFLSFDE